MGEGRGDIAVPDLEQAIYANEEGKACVAGSFAADGTFENRRGGCSSTRGQSSLRGQYRWWMDEIPVPSPRVDVQRRSSRLFPATIGLYVEPYRCNFFVVVIKVSFR